MPFWSYHCLLLRKKSTFCMMSVLCSRKRLSNVRLDVNTCSSQISYLDSLSLTSVLMAVYMNCLVLRSSCNFFR